MKQEKNNIDGNINKIALSGLSPEEIHDVISSRISPWEKFRTKQVCAWLYVKASADINEWTNLGLKAREALQEKFKVQNINVLERQKSKIDGTEKFLFELSDGELTETVLMRTDKDNKTICVSSQVGCAVKCPFCETGKLGFRRNLKYYEIVDQIVSVRRLTGEQINNIVYMGQGEPLNNLDEVLKSIKIIRESLGIGVRSITLSTSGIVPKIKVLAKEKLGINLAVSLHSARQDVREKLVPVAKTWDLFELIQALTSYFRETKRRITFEYTLIEGINDSREDALVFCDMLKELEFECLVNIIPYNSGDSREFKHTSNAQVENFKGILERSGRKVTVRKSMGNDIMAACGQLSNARILNTKSK